MFSVNSYVHEIFGLEIVRDRHNLKSTLNVVNLSINLVEQRDNPTPSNDLFLRLRNSQLVAIWRCFFSKNQRVSAITPLAPESLPMKFILSDQSSETANMAIAPNMK